MPYSSSQAFLHTAAAAQTASDTAYVYDGWNLVAEYTIVDNGASVDLLQAYTWGLDLSGSMQGAGGVGGLLCIHRLPDLDDGSRIWGATFYLTYDGNGKIGKYLYDTGDEESRFEYDPSRQVVAPTDSWDDFTYRFSTKPQDAETGLYYYGYRYYDPVTGRWPSRDPIGERGGLNLYGFVGNDGISVIDVLGLYPINIDIHSDWYNRLPDNIRRELINNYQGRELEPGPPKGEDTAEDIARTLAWLSGMTNVDPNYQPAIDRLNDLSTCKDKSIFRYLDSHVDDYFGYGYTDGRTKPFERSVTALSLAVTVYTGSDPGSLALDMFSVMLPNRPERWNIVSTLYEVIDVRVCCEDTSKETVTVLGTRTIVVISLEQNYGL